MDKVQNSHDIVKFSRALAMYQLAHLPTRPQTCPFCVQHSEGNRCEGCGYALTHGGKCDAETSAFGQFIEAVYDLAGVIHGLQDGKEPKIDADEGRDLLKQSIRGSRVATKSLIEALPWASTDQFMVIKARYIEEILKEIPSDLMASDEVDVALRYVLDKLKGYW